MRALEAASGLRQDVETLLIDHVVAADADAVASGLQPVQCLDDLAQRPGVGITETRQDTDVPLFVRTIDELGLRLLLFFGEREDALVMKQHLAATSVEAVTNGPNSVGGLHESFAVHAARRCTYISRSRLLRTGCATARIERRACAFPAVRWRHGP